MGFLEEMSISNEQALLVLLVFSIVFFTALANLIAGRIFKKLKTTSGKTGNLWDDALVYALVRPVKMLIWIIGLTIAAEFAFSKIIENDGEKILGVVSSIRSVGVILCITWFCLRFVKYIENNIFKNSKDDKIKLDKTTASAIAKLVRVAIIITSLLIMMQTLGFSIGGILAFGGVGGIAIGYAAKDLLANFFGAIMIYLDRPFSVGDWIRSPDKAIEGTVEEIGWRQTRIRTFDKRPLYVPNSAFSTIVVENPSRMTNRRIYETIGVRYDDIANVNKITEEVKNMLRTHDEIDEKQTLIVNLNKFSESSVDFFVYTFTKTTDWIKFHEIKQEILLTIAEIIENNNSEIAFPTSTIHIADSELIGDLNA